MRHKILIITGDPIGEGQERICYRHPEDSDKINRRWERCMRQLKIYSDQMIADYGASPKPLDAAYRRTG